MLQGKFHASLAFCAVYLFFLCEAEGLGAAAPWKVALVQWREVRHRQGHTPFDGGHAPASALRAAGYPVVTQLSKPPFQRAADVLVASKHSTNAVGMATPITLGPKRPNPLIAADINAPASRKLQQMDSLQYLRGFEGISSSAPAGTTALAAGPHHLLYASGRLVSIFNLTDAAEAVTNTQESATLASLFSAVSGECDGVYDPSAVFDFAANRFLMSATCGGHGLVLVAVSATSDAAGTWFVAALVADGVGTPLACSNPVKEAALVDYTQLSYNADGVYITYKSICPSNATNHGVGALAIPKWALYRGLPMYQYPVYTSAELSNALLEQAADSSSPTTVEFAGSGDGEAAGQCAQLVPVVPQEAADVGQGTAHFVCELIDAHPSHKSRGRAIAVYALVDTGSLWQYGGPSTNTSAPVLVAQQVQLDAPSSPVTGLPLRQPSGAQALQLGTRPRGFWNGAAVLSAGQMYIATSTLVHDSSSPGYMRRPGIAWAQLSVSSSTQGIDSCPQSRAGVASRQAADWDTDFSQVWGLQVCQLSYRVYELTASDLPSSWDPNWHPQGAAAPIEPVDESVIGSDRTVHAAGLLHPVLGAAQFAAVGLSQLGASPCTCYSCYWGGQYNRYGGYNGGALAGSGAGFASGGYFFQQNTMSRCQSFCTRCWYYGYPGHGFGNIGEDRTFLDVQAAVPFAVSVSEATPADGPSLSVNTATAAVTEAIGLFTPCARSGSLQAHVVRQGIVTQGAPHPLGLAFPAIAVGASGQLLITYTLSGPGNISSHTPAFPGVGASLVQPGSNSSSVVVLQRGWGTIRPAALAGGGGVPPSGGWAELSAVAVHSWSHTAFTVSHYAAARQAEASSVGSWISSWQL